MQVYLGVVALFHVVPALLFFRGVRDTCIFLDFFRPLIEVTLVSHS